MEQKSVHVHKLNCFRYILKHIQFVGPDVKFPTWLDPLLPAQNCYHCRIGAGTILNDCNETMRRVSQSQIREPRDATCILNSRATGTQKLLEHMHMQDLIAIPAQGAGGLLCFCLKFRPGPARVGLGPSPARADYRRTIFQQNILFIGRPI